MNIQQKCDVEGIVAWLDGALEFQNRLSPGKLIYLPTTKAQEMRNILRRILVAESFHGIDPKTGECCEVIVGR